MSIDQKIVLLSVLIAVFAIIVHWMMNTPQKKRKETSRVYNGMSPVHPGEVILDELRELNMPSPSLATVLNMPVETLNSILEGKRDITGDTALRLARYFGTGPELWLNLQKTYELRLAEIKTGEEINRSVQPRVAAT